MNTFECDTFFTKEEIRRERIIVAGTEENPEVEVQTVYFNDGSHTEISYDYIGNCGEIKEYDMHGNLVACAYGTFGECEPPAENEEIARMAQVFFGDLSDEEIARITQAFMEDNI